jgi:hypothetical protein
MTDETASNKLLGIELVAVKKIGTAIALLIGHIEEEEEDINPWCQY